jgi:hypothetical protein
LTRTETIVAAALANFTPAQRDELTAPAYIKATELLAKGDDDATIITAVRNHARYTARKERRQCCHAKVSDATPARIDRHVAERDLMDKLDKTDRTLVAMLLAGCAQQDCRRRLRLGHTKLKARMARIARTVKGDA